MKTKEEFQVGKYNIGYIDSDLFQRLPAEFEARELGTYQTLPRNMTDSEIETELNVGLCELGDVLAFLQNPPTESKDGRCNLFYTGSCVVCVRWGTGGGEWSVDAWRRDDNDWVAGNQVFSPATAPKTLSKKTLRNSDSLPLPSKKQLQGFLKMAKKEVKEWQAFIKNVEKQLTTKR